MINYKMNSIVSAVRDEETIQSVIDRVNKIMSGSSDHVSKQWSRAQGWVAGPAVLDGLSDGWQSRLPAWMNSTGIGECFGITLPADKALQQLRMVCPDGTGFEACYRVPASYDGLMAFERERLGCNFALMPANQSWLLSLTDELFFAAGKRDFVVSILGCPLEDVMYRFCEDSFHLRSAGDSAIKYLDGIQDYYIDMLSIRDENG